MDDTFFLDDEDILITNEVGDGEQGFVPNNEQLVDPLDQVQKEFATIPPLVTDQQAPSHHISKKRSNRYADIVNVNLTSKKPKSKDTSDKARQLSEIVVQKPILSTSISGLVAKKKASRSNPLMRESLAYGSVLVRDWLNQNCPRLAELEALPEKLNSSKVELKKVTDKLDSS